MEGYSSLTQQLPVIRMRRGKELWLIEARHKEREEKTPEKGVKDQPKKRQEEEDSLEREGMLILLGSKLTLFVVSLPQRIAVIEDKLEGVVGLLREMLAFKTQKAPANYERMRRESEDRDREAKRTHYSSSEEGVEPTRYQEERRSPKEKHQEDERNYEDENERNEKHRREDEGTG